MAIKRENPYKELEHIVMEKVFSLENENTQLRQELAIAQAKLSIYEKLTNVSDSKMALGFNSSNCQ